MRNWARRWRARGEASCAEVARVLQSYLDGQVDDLTAQRVHRHLEHCRRCGLEAETYEAIKDAIARRAARVDPATLERLRAFGERLAEEGPTGESGSTA
jgi:anti-sigma factor (TIGR02949 family)